jgi:KTSC domain
MGEGGGGIEFWPRSGSIEAVRWVPAGSQSEVGDLRVTFVGGRRYEYGNVPRAVVEAFREASSAGSFFNTEIRWSY